jgi:hypothetical protein
MADGIAAGALFAFFRDRTGAFTSIPAVSLDLLKGSHRGPAEVMGFVSRFRLPLLTRRSPLEFLSPKPTLAWAGLSMFPKTGIVGTGWVSNHSARAVVVDPSQLFSTKRLHRRSDGPPDDDLGIAVREFVTDLAPERAVLGEAEMVGVCRPTSTNQARLFGHELDVLPVTNAAWLRMGQPALVNGLGIRWHCAKNSLTEADARQVEDAARIRCAQTAASSDEAISFTSPISCPRNVADASASRIILAGFETIIRPRPML